MSEAIYVVVEGFQSNFRNIYVTKSFVEAIARVEDLRTKSMTLVDANHYTDEETGSTIVYQVAEPGEQSNYFLIERWGV